MRLAILLPTLPAYRKDFLENLNARLQGEDINLTVIHGTGFFKKSIKSDINPKYPAQTIDAVEFKFLGYRIVWWKGIFRKIRSLKPDIIIILFSPGNLTFWLVQLYCYLAKIRIGIWSSGFVRKEIKGIKKTIREAFLNFFLYRAKFHICYGTKYKNELLAMGIDESKVFVAQNTIYIEKILSLDIDRSKNLSESRIKFLFVGALIREKNLGLAVKAVKQLVTEGYPVHFDIVGQGSIIEELRSLVDSEKMEEFITVPGPMYDAQLTSYFINADIFFLPGTGGLAINEAMAYGLPVLSTIGDGTVTDLLYEGINGYYLDDEASIENLCLVCKKALANSKLQLNEMGVRSRQIIKEKATLQNMVEGYVSAVLYSIS